MNDDDLGLTFVLEGCISNSGTDALRGRIICSCFGVVGVGGGVNGGIMELELLQLKNGGLKGCKAVGLDGGVDRTGVKTGVVSILSLDLESVSILCLRSPLSPDCLLFLLDFVLEKKPI
jgi:hypothetical protein